MNSYYIHTVFIPYQSLQLEHGIFSDQTRHAAAVAMNTLTFVFLTAVHVGLYHYKHTYHQQHPNQCNIRGYRHFKNARYYGTIATSIAIDI